MSTAAKAKAKKSQKKHCACCKDAHHKISQVRSPKDVACSCLKKNIKGKSSLGTAKKSNNAGENLKPPENILHALETTVLVWMALVLVRSWFSSSSLVFFCSCASNFLRRRPRRRRRRRRLWISKWHFAGSLQPPGIGRVINESGATDELLANFFVRLVLVKVKEGGINT